MHINRYAVGIMHLNLCKPIYYRRFLRRWWSFIYTWRFKTPRSHWTQRYSEYSKMQLKYFSRLTEPIICESAMSSTVTVTNNIKWNALEKLYKYIRTFKCKLILNEYIRCFNGLFISISFCTISMLYTKKQIKNASNKYMPINVLSSHFVFSESRENPQQLKTNRLCKYTSTNAVIYK